MASVQDIRRRIRSVGNTRKITRAMELVAAAKLRRAQARTFEGRVSRRLDGPVVLLLSPELEVRAQTPGTHDALRLLVPRSSPARSLAVVCWS